MIMTAISPEAPKISVSFVNEEETLVKIDDLESGGTITISSDKAIELENAISNLFLDKAVREGKYRQGEE
jgi:hypothetical protein